MPLPVIPTVSKSASPQRGVAEVTSLHAASGPSGASPLLEHPALQDLLCPLPLTKQGGEVKALIDRRVQELATCSPQLIAAGVSFCNHPGDGETPVINLPEFKEKRTLLWSEVAPFRAADAMELAEVARQIEAKLGVPCDAEGALTVLVERMKTLLRESVISALARERAYQLEDALKLRESSLLRKLPVILPAVRAKDEALQAEIRSAFEDAELHAKPHGEKYCACRLRGAVSLMFKRLDSLWYYRNAMQEDTAQRINEISIALASLGIFQKGEGGWDQRYPSSPLQFWKDHVEKS